MGKIRVKTLGDEKQEKKDAKKAEARAVAKKAREDAEARKAATEVTPKEATSQPEEIKAETPKIETKKTTTATKKKKSASYQKATSLLDKKKKYKLSEALPLLAQLKRAKFDETVELHINTTEKGITGSLTLPHGTGKATRVVIANYTADPKHVEELIKTIESGKINFDVLIATPDTMPKLAKVARVLGPRGLMPNPKSGTVTQKPDEIAKKFEGGQFTFKTESKFPILHLAVGKLSFGDQKLSDNISTAVKAINVKNIRSMTLKSTMSPGILIETSNI